MWAAALIFAIPIVIGIICQEIAQYQELKQLRESNALLNARIRKIRLAEHNAKKEVR